MANSIVTEFHVTVMGPGDASDEQVRRLERILLDALREVAEEFKRKEPKFSLKISQ